MGGKSSCIDENTKNVMFESATFKRDSIRKTSRALGKRSDSSSRYEKGTDGYGAELGLKRALSLISKLGAGKIASSYIDVNFENTEPKVLNTKISKINKVLGIDVPSDVISDILARLNFGVTVNDDDISIVIPPYRNDIEDYPCIAEEVIRMYGYDHIVDTLLDDASITVGGLNKAQKDVETLKNYLVSQGYYEAITYSFISEKDYDNLKLDKDSDEYKFVKILNPLGEDVSVMRTTLIPSMLKVIANNLNKKNLSGRIFEFAKEYHPISLPLTELPIQQDCVALGAFGDGEDFFTLKGTVEGLLSTLKATFKVDYVKCNRSFMHPNRSAEIVIGNKTIGFIGELHPSIAEKLGIDKRVYVGEIFYDVISKMLNRKLIYKQISKYPSVERDLALVMDNSVTNGETLRYIKKFGDKTLTNIEIFDIYTGGQLAEQGKKSMAYHLTFSMPDRSLTLEEVDKTVNKILNGLNSVGIELR